MWLVAECLIRLMPKATVLSPYQIPSAEASAFTIPTPPHGPFHWLCTTLASAGTPDYDTKSYNMTPSFPLGGVNAFAAISGRQAKGPLRLKNSLKPP